MTLLVVETTTASGLRRPFRRRFAW